MPDQKRSILARFLHGDDPVWTKASMGAVTPPVPFGNSAWQSANYTTNGRIYGGNLPELYAGSHVDFARAVGELEQASAVMACVQWVQRAFAEAPPRVLEKTADGEQEIEDHDVTRLLDEPNPFMSGAELFQALIADYDIHGNAYALKFRAATGRVAELWWEPQLTIRPVWDSAGTAFLTGYEVMRFGRWLPFPATDVIQFRWGSDRRNQRLGISPLRSALRAVMIDAEAEALVATLLHNLGIPGVVISPAAEKAVDPMEAARLMAYFQSRFTGDGRGSAFVASQGLKVDMLSFSPEQMNVRGLRQLSEERICALLGVPPIVAGLGAGLEHGTYSNYEQAREAAYESNLLPTYRVFGNTLTRALLRDDFNGKRNQRVDFDTTNIRALQDDENKTAARWSLLYKTGIAKRSEARAAVDLDIGPDDDVYFVEPGAATATARVVPNVPPALAAGTPNDPNAVPTLAAAPPAESIAAPQLNDGTTP